MKIPLVEKLPPDICIPKGPRKGEHRYYKTALWNTLLHLKPRLCLEIGTWKGGSTKIFQRYFAEHRPDGYLVTADIKFYVLLTDSRIRHVRVYPHTADILDLFKKIKPGQLLPHWRERVDNSVALNSEILLTALSSVRSGLFDFAFVDGDHWHLGKDMEIVENVLRRDGYALLDDTTAYVWPSSQFYHDEIKPVYETYDFEDWPVFPGTSLVWKR